MSSDTLKFLDVSNYLTPGTSYDTFLKAFGASLQKSFFPYEWFDSEEKLDQTHLPDKDAFFSRLKGYNVLDKEYDDFCSFREKHNLSEEEAPKTGYENYEELKRLWHEKGMTRFADFLQFYNNRDVEPFVEAVEKMMVFYVKNGIDLFKDTISVPGAARQMLMKMKDPDCHFTLFSNFNKDIYMKIKNNIVGGPSIIFHR